MAACDNFSTSSDEENEFVGFLPEEINFENLKRRAEESDLSIDEYSSSGESQETSDKDVSADGQRSSAMFTSKNLQKMSCRPARKPSRKWDLWMRHSEKFCEVTAKPDACDEGKKVGAKATTRGGQNMAKKWNNCNGLAGKEGKKACKAALIKHKPEFIKNFGEKKAEGWQSQEDTMPTSRSNL
eukprot:gene7345-13077_t